MPKELTILGYVPRLLDLLIELAEDAGSYAGFNILENIPCQVNTTRSQEDRLRFYRTYDTFFEWNMNLSNCTLAVVGCHSKSKVVSYFENLLTLKRQDFVNLIHPTCVFSKYAATQSGLQMEPLSTVCSRSSIGFAVNIKRNCSVGHHCIIQDYVTINPGVTICSDVVIGKGSMIGAGSTVKDGVAIGDNTLIGAGSVVIHDIPSNCVAFGAPCQVIGPIGDRKF